MPATLALANDLLKMILQGLAIPNICDTAAVSPIGTLYVSLHTADPGAGATQDASEATYTGYGRRPVTRDAAGWTVTGAGAAPNAAITFGQMTAGSAQTVTHVGIGIASSGATKLLLRGALTPPRALTVGTTPQIGAGSTINFITA